MKSKARKSGGSFRRKKQMTSLHAKQGKNRTKSVHSWVEERNAALFSLNERKIKNYCKKYEVPIPEDKTVFWAGVYKMILAIPTAPMKLKLQAAQWLGEHGFSMTIYGGGSNG